jgi:2-oxoglutarate ferredoxin oxidoreductase subunit delta
MTLERDLLPDARMSEDKPKRRVRGLVVIRADRCKGCALCVEFCPTNALALSAEFTAKGYHPPEFIDPEACSGCDLCGMYCPDFAIYGYRIKEERETAAAS